MTKVLILAISVFLFSFDLQAKSSKGVGGSWTKLETAELSDKEVIENLQKRILFLDKRDEQLRTAINDMQEDVYNLKCQLQGYC